MEFDDIRRIRWSSTKVVDSSKKVEEFRIFLMFYSSQMIVVSITIQLIDFPNIIYRDKTS